MADIKIIGVDKDRTHRAIGLDKEEPFKLYDIYLELSEAPPSGWRRVFQGYNPRSHELIDVAWISGKYLVITCALELLGVMGPDLPTFLKKLIEQTNTQYREHLAKKAAQADRERELIARALDKLVFD